MGLGVKHLKACHSSLYRFTGDLIQPLGVIELALTMGEQPRQTTIMANFIVVDCALAYAVLGRPSLRELKAITSIYHLAVKFPTPKGIASMKREQKEARECYNTSLRTFVKPWESMAMVMHGGKNPQELDPRVIEELGAEPVEDLEEIVVMEEPLQKLKVGKSLQDDTKEKLVRFLKDNLNVFAWIHEDMAGIDPSIMCHHLNINLEARPVRQKRRAQDPERYEALKEEVEKLKANGFICEAFYPVWVSNPVLVPKSNGKRRTCVEFSNLNRACPKDSFPLPRIDQLVDETAGHELLSFMDVYYR
ncbi:uncharacterized protein LOC133806568 [Humulus lupulus]|uniref:uncharacterized protein LOC133806568 n=1 Tax=Humulus lupulus TaxID=3486 RepID=UPI002B4139D6|nr:uncharacterized protein LOC133806568 [Humulus lupulus]